MPKFEIPKSGSKSPVPENFNKHAKQKRLSIASASTQPSHNGSFHSSGSDNGTTQPSSVMQKRREMKAKKGGNPMTESYRAIWACNDNWGNELGKFFDDIPFVDETVTKDDMLGYDATESKLMTSPLNPLLDMTDIMSSHSGEFFVDARLSTKHSSSRDIDAITDGLHQTATDVGAIMWANDYSAVEGRPEALRRPGVGVSKHIRSRHSKSSSRDGNSKRTLTPPNPLFFSTGGSGDRWKGSFDAQLKY